MKLRTIIEQNDTRGGRVFDLTSQFLIWVSLISFCVETLPSLSAEFHEILQIVEIVIVVLFTIEYLLRVFVSEHKLRFIFSFYGLMDLAAILPPLLALALDLRSIRIVRVFRLFRGFKVLRYNNAINKFKAAISSIKEELILFVFATVVLLYLASVGIYYCEYEAQSDIFISVFHCFWWAVVTLTTVGYGDMYPVTVGGKIFTSIISLIGIGIVAVPTGLLVSALTRPVKEEDESL